MRGSGRWRKAAGQLGKLTWIKSRAAHHISRTIADRMHTVGVEDLRIKSMIRSAKGMVEESGTNVKAKSGLHHFIPSGNRGNCAEGWTTRPVKW